MLKLRLWFLRADWKRTDLAIKPQPPLPARTSAMTKTNNDLVYKICLPLRPQAEGATTNISQVWTAEHH